MRQGRVFQPATFAVLSAGIDAAIAGGLPEPCGTGAAIAGDVASTIRGRGMPENFFQRSSALSR